MSPRKARGGSPGIFAMMAAARRYRAGGTGPKATLMALMERMGVHDGEWCCWPEVADLADDTEQNAGTVRRHLAKLADDGLLQRRHQGREGGGRAANVWVLNTDVLYAGGPEQTAHIARPAAGANRASEGGQTAHPTLDAPIANTQVTTKGGAYAPAATALVRAWWDQRKAAGNPVGQPFIACTKVVTSMLAQGVAANRIEWALRAAPVCSTGALEFAIQHRLAKGGQGDPVALAAEVREQLLRQEAGQ